MLWVLHWFECGLHIERANLEVLKWDLSVVFRGGDLKSHPSWSFPDREDYSNNPSFGATS
jgi:hypothetical protein